MSTDQAIKELNESYRAAVCTGCDDQAEKILKKIFQLIEYATKIKA